jgi:hypothetical protein
VIAPEPKPLACTLDADAAAEQVAEWARLGGALLRSERTAAGARLWFEPGVERALREVAAREAACCRFLRLDVHATHDVIRLDITSDSADGAAVAHLLADGIERSRP